MRLRLKEREAVNFGAGTFVKEVFEIDQYEIRVETVSYNGTELEDELENSVIYRIDCKEWKPVTVVYDYEAEDFKIQINVMKTLGDEEATEFLAEFNKARKIAQILADSIG